MESSRLLRILALSVLSLGLSACALVHRSYVSGYGSVDEERSEVNSFYQQRYAYQEQLARQDLGWSMDQPLTPQQENELKLHMRLRQLESRLQTQRAKRQYYQLKGQMANDRERIEFLSLPSVEMRQRWALDRGLIGKDTGNSPAIVSLINKKDIAVGMSQKAVMESWGDPDNIAVAGDPVYGNERWRYSRYISSADGYDKQIRFVYFEAGRVVGWQTYHP